MEFLLGLRCAAFGLARLVTTPSLWAWGLAPSVLTIVVLTAASVLGHGAFQDLAKEWAGEDSAGSAGLSALYWIAFLVLVWFTFATVARIVAAPLLVLLADRTIVGMTGRPTPAAPGGPVVRWVLRPFAEALLVFGIRLAATVLALPLLLVPVAGAVLFGLVTMALLGLDLVDIAQSARGVLLGARLKFVMRHASASIGLGIGAGLLLLVPCVGLFLLPATVVAAVSLDRALAPDFPAAAAA